MPPPGRRALFVLTDTSPYGASRVAAVYRRALVGEGWTVEPTDRWGRTTATGADSAGSADGAGSGAGAVPVGLVVAVHLASGPAAAWLARRHGATLVVLAQNQPRFRGPRPVRWAKRRLHRLGIDRADVVVAVSEQVADELRATCRPRRLAVVDNAVVDNAVVDNAVAAPALEAVPCDGSAGADPVVVGVGRLHPQKGFDRLVAAMPAVLEAEPAARLVVVGGEVPGAPGHRDDLLALADALGVADAVTFAGPRTDVAEVWADATVVAVPSRWDGRSLAALEAMANGVPVVLSDRCGIREFADGVHGALVPGDPDTDPDTVATALAEAIVATLRLAPAERRRRVDAARALATARTVDDMATEFLAAIP